MLGLLKAVAIKLRYYKLNFILLGEFRLNKLGDEWAVDFYFTFENGNE
jgi:hypothetical protein